MPYKDKNKKREQQRRYNSRPDIKAKRSEYHKRYRSQNKERLDEREAKRRLEKRAQCMIATVRTRCKRKGIEFGLDSYVAEIQARVDKGRCELTGYPFSLEPGKPFNTPSIDRIDPSNGYIYDNIRIVLHLVNCAMGDWGERILQDVMERWLSCQK
jgi:hypothetical protein